MINALAHITASDAPTGLLLFFAGCAAGALVMSLVYRIRAS